MNKYEKHLFVLPEDDANRQIADGFVLHDQVDTRRIQVMPEVGGWPNLLKTFQDEYLKLLRTNAKAHVAMIIDFDDDVNDRRAMFEQAIPDELKPRVFVVGSSQNPEALRIALRMNFERIGASLANDCHADTTEHWDHEQLRHNDTERQRLVQTVKPFLFRC